MSAVAAYVRILSKKNSVPRSKLGKNVAIEPDVIRRIEQGEIEPNVEQLTKLVVACQGDFADIQQLVIHPATEADGERLALERVKLNSIKADIAKLDRKELTHIIRYALDRLDLPLDPTQ